MASNLETDESCRVPCVRTEYGFSARLLVRTQSQGIISGKLLCRRDYDQSPVISFAFRRNETIPDGKQVNQIRNPGQTGPRSLTSRQNGLKDGQERGVGQILAQE